MSAVSPEGKFNRGLASLSAKAGRSLEHNPQQFHATPPAAPFALMQVEGRRIACISRLLWECACGDGALAHVLEAHGHEVIGTDIAARGYGLAGVDFLEEAKLRAPVIITNPPFGEAGADFIRQAAKLEALYLALLLPIGFFHPTAQAERDVLWRELPPTRVWPLGFRLDFTGGGRPPAMPMAWFVWDWSMGMSRHHDRQFKDRYARLMPPLRKPDLTAAPVLHLPGGRS